MSSARFAASSALVAAAPAAVLLCAASDALVPIRLLYTRLAIARCRSSGSAFSQAFRPRVLA
ncbi:hypothetical protein AHU45_09380 [Salmonella enterica subsp. enterica]|nr:hypothetical protein [Salmonella enterica subsp. enterica]